MVVDFEFRLKEEFVQTTVGNKVRATGARASVRAVIVHGVCPLLVKVSKK